MKLDKIIITICFSLIMLFASGADANPMWVTLLGMLIPMGVLYLLVNHD